MNSRRLHGTRLLATVLLVPVVSSLVLSSIHAKTLGRPATIRVYLDRPQGVISPLIFGHFTELTLRSFEKGVSSELLPDRKFEAPREPTKGSLSKNTSEGWLPLEPFVEDRYISLHMDGHTFFSPPWSQRITLTPPGTGPAGIYCVPLHIKGSERYKVRIAVRVLDASGPVYVALGTSPENAVARHAFYPEGQQWQTHECRLAPTSDLEDARFMIYIESPGTVWVDSVSLVCASSDDAGFRKDALALAQRMNPTILRFPGGCFADDYHWQDGIGPIDTRPSVYNRAWRRHTTNDVGTDEFIALCRKLGAEPNLCVNFGTGTAQEAAAWVEYCNGPPDSPWGKVRADNGHPEPYNVEYWGIGNEVCYANEIGATNAKEYGKGFIEFAKTMRAVDSSIQLIAVGVVDVDEKTVKDDPETYQSVRYWVDWTKQFMAIAGNEIDQYAIHYYGPMNTSKLESDDEKMAACLAIAEDLGMQLDLLVEDLRNYAPGRKAIPIALDEWACSQRGGGPSGGLLKALAEACVVNMMQNRPRDFAMACRTILYAAAYGIIAIDENKAIATPSALMMELYATRDHCRSLKTEVKSEKFRVKPFRPQRRGVVIGWLAVGEFPYLHVSSRIHPDDRTVDVFVVNRNAKREIETTITWVGGEVEPTVNVSELMAKKLLSRNPFGNPNNLKITSRVVSTDGRELKHVFPAHSVTRLTAFAKPDQIHADAKKAAHRKE
jgi:alpha-N-arabinofuranosidase